MTTANVSAGPPDVAQRWLLKTFDGLLAGVIFIAPVFMGGRHPVGELVYVSLVAVAACAWTIRLALAARGVWRLSGVEVLLVAAIGVVALQLISLPSNVLAQVSPLGGELLPLWSSGGASARLGSWTTISLIPHATRGQLVILLAHVMLFILVVQRVRCAEDVQRLVRWIALAAVAMATLGLLQFFAGNGKFFWVYEHPSRSTAGAVKGMFANQNHLASFLALGLGPLMAWIAQIGQSSSPRNKASARRGGGWRHIASGARNPDHHWQRPLLLVGLGVVAFAGLLTFSRGGVIVLAVVAAIAIGLLVFVGVLGRRSVAGLGVALFFVIAALFIFGYQPLAKQIATLGSGKIDEIDPGAVRMSLWAADLQAVARSPIFGTGAGTHAEVYKSFMPHHYDYEFTHAESSYVHVLLETGAAGLLICAGLLLASLRWCIGAMRGGDDPRRKMLAAAIAAGLVASAVHSVWDFVWLLPACMSLTIVLAACACRLFQFSGAESPLAMRTEHADNSPGEFVMSRFTWAMVATIALGTSVLMINNRTGPALASSGWERFLALRKAEAELGDSVNTELLMQPLVQSLAHDEGNRRVHLRMAALCIRRFEDEQQQSDVPMPLSQIRDAALASAFSGRQQQDAWINRVTGENRIWLDRALYHVHRSLQLCPLQGEAYTLLAELAFLHGPGAIDQSALLSQALRIRPHDAHVLFAAGREAALKGDDERAIAMWQKAFHQEEKYRSQIIAMVAPRIPVEAFMEHFSPKPEQLSELFEFYREAQLTDQARGIAVRLAGHAEQQAANSTGTESAELWNKACSFYVFLGRDEKALRCIEHAVAANPLKYEHHRTLAARLLDNDRYDEAIIQLRWCRQHRHGDERVERLWELARRGPNLQQLETANTPAQDETRH